MNEALGKVMNVIPLTPGGIGITEEAFSFLFQNMGFDSGATLGLLGRVIQYLTFTAGGSVALLTVRMRARPKDGGKC